MKTPGRLGKQVAIQTKVPGLEEMKMQIHKGSIECVNFLIPLRSQLRQQTLFADHFTHRESNLLRCGDTYTAAMVKDSILSKGAEIVRYKKIIPVKWGISL